MAPLYKERCQVLLLDPEVLRAVTMVSFSLSELGTAQCCNRGCLLGEKLQPKPPPASASTGLEMCAVLWKFRSPGFKTSRCWLQSK